MKSIEESQQLPSGGVRTSASGIALTHWDAGLYAHVSARWLDRIRRWMPSSAMVGISVDHGSGDLHLARWALAHTDFVWVQAPNRSCVESVSIDGALQLTVVNDASWVTKEPTGMTIGESRPEDVPLGVIQALNPRHAVSAQALLQPKRLMYNYDVTATDEIRIAGRQAITFRALPTYEPESVVASGFEDAPLVFEGADEAEFVMDIERGVVLRWSGLVGGHVYESTQFHSIAFDDPIDGQMFDVAAILKQVKGKDDFDSY